MENSGRAMHKNKEQLLPDISSYHDSSRISFNEEKDEHEGSKSKSKSKVSKFHQIGNMSFSTIVINNNTTTFHPLVDSIQKFQFITFEPQFIQPQIEDTEAYSPTMEEKKIRRKTVFPKLTPLIHKEYSEQKKYGMIKCKMITTYFYGRYTFSLFTNPKQVETDSRAKLRFLIREENGRFQLNENFIYTLASESNECVDNLKLRNFIDSLNEFFFEDDYVEIITIYKIKKVVYLFLSLMTIVLLLLQIAFGCSQLLLNTNGGTIDFWIFIASYVLTFLALCYLCYRFLISFFRNKGAKDYALIQHYLKNYSRVQIFFEDWNRVIFFPCSILASCPVTIDYIQFNLDPFQEIELEPHTVEEIK